jgi:GT2 family glycosyltransferase/2-polyprenyl-3-methyl-5-hydroxy-6-metoxy-1,4-benzoquinol methylase
MSTRRGSDVAIVIPTLCRSPIFARTLAALRSQTVDGFEIIVVVDGEGLDTPPPGASRVVVQRHAGAAAARNAGVRISERPIILFLDDDMLPDTDLVERHLDMHRAHPERATAVLGAAAWHPDVAGNRINRWLDWSHTQFDYSLIRDRGGEDVGWGRFFSCNLSLHRDFFHEAGGFDESFIVYYEDTDLGLRLGQIGLHLFYQPRARAWHYQRYDLKGIQRRFERVAVGERLMVAKHSGFEPFFLRRAREARRTAPRLSLWPHLVERLPQRVVELRPGVVQAVRRRANLVYYRRLADAYERAYERAGGIIELRDYLGDDYDPSLLVNPAEVHQKGRPSLYELTTLAARSSAEPCIHLLRRHLPAQGRVLDYRCGIGTNGILLLEQGYRVAFADVDNPCLEYLRWRLARRGLMACVYDLDRDEIPGGFDAACGLGSLNGVDDWDALLRRLDERARVVAVNLASPEPSDVAAGQPMALSELRDHALRRRLLTYRVLPDRSHLFIYRGSPASVTPTLASRAALLRDRAGMAARRLSHVRQSDGDRRPFFDRSARW